VRGKFFVRSEGSFGFPEAGFRVLICTLPILDYFRMADHPPGISVSLQVEHKQFIGNGHLIGSSLR